MSQRADAGVPSDTPIPLPVTTTVQACLTQLRPALRRVAEFVLENSSVVSTMSVETLAQICDVSTATVVRFCQSIGLSGYRDLRLGLAAETGGREHFGVGLSGAITGEDSLEDLVAKVAYADARAIEATAAALDGPTLQSVVDAIIAARKVVIFGVESSALAVTNLAQHLIGIDILAFAWADANSALAATALTRPGDVAIGVSHSGVTYAVVDALALARVNGATTVAITSNPRSSLVAQADHVLLTVIHEGTFRSAEMASRAAQLMVVDCIFAAVARVTYEHSEVHLRAVRTAVEVHRPLSGRSGRTRRSTGPTA